MAKQKSKKRSNNTDVIGIIGIALSLILMLGLYTNAVGYFSYISKTIFVSLLGIGAFILPVYLLYISITYIKNKGSIKINRTFVLITIAIINTLIFVQALNFHSYYDKLSLWNSVKAIVNSQSYFHSGVIGFFISLPLVLLIGTIGTYLINFLYILYV